VGNFVPPLQIKFTFLPCSAGTRRRFRAGERSGRCRWRVMSDRSAPMSRPSCRNTTLAKIPGANTKRCRRSGLKSFGLGRRGLAEGGPGRLALASHEARAMGRGAQACDAQPTKRCSFSSSALFAMRRSFRSGATRGFVGTPVGSASIGAGKRAGTRPGERRSTWPLRANSGHWTTAEVSGVAVAYPGWCYWFKLAGFEPERKAPTQAPL
jgi:hypothetical protein